MFKNYPYFILKIPSADKNTHLQKLLPSKTPVQYIKKIPSCKNRQTAEAGSERKKPPWAKTHASGDIRPLKNGESVV